MVIRRGYHKISGKGNSLATIPVKLRFISCAREAPNDSHPKSKPTGATLRDEASKSEEVRNTRRGRIHGMARNREDPREGRRAHLSGGSTGEAVAGTKREHPTRWRAQDTPLTPPFAGRTKERREERR